MWVYGPDWAGPGQRQVAGGYECGNEPSGSVKCGEFLDQLQTSQLLKKDSAPWRKYVNKQVLYNVIEHQFGHLPSVVPGCTVSKTLNEWNT